MKNILIISVFAFFVADAFAQVTVKGKQNVKSDLKIEKLLIHIVNDPATIDFFDSFAAALKQSLEQKHIEAIIYLPTSYDSLQFQEHLNNGPNAIIFISGNKSTYNLNTRKEKIIHEMTLVHRKGLDKNQNIWTGSLKLTLNDRMKQYARDSAIELVKLWTKTNYVRD